MNYIVKDSKVDIIEGDIDGKSLSYIIENNITLSEEQIFFITESILEILFYFSSLKPIFIHGNINPENIIMNDDFIALVDKKIENNDDFIAPESLKGRVSIQSDLYSLGVTLVLLVTRKKISELEIMYEKIQFRKETGINTFFKNFLDELIQPNYKYRMKNSKKALKYINKIKKGKFGKDRFAIGK
jgi:serine/threonine protein kinase